RRKRKGPHRTADAATNGSRRGRGSRGEAAATPARAGRVRILEHEPAAHHLVLVVDFRAGQVEQALGVDEDPDPAVLHQLVVLARLLLHEVQRVAETAATAPLYPDAKVDLVRLQLLLLHDLLDRGGGSFRQEDVRILVAFGL